MQQLTVRLKLLPDDTAHAALLKLIRDVNECCNWISAEAWLAQKFRRFDLHHLVYRRGRECFDLRADVTCQAIAKVAAAYAANQRRCAVFREDGAIGIHPGDMRMGDRSVRIAATGEHLVIPFLVNERDSARMSGKIGAARLILTEAGLVLNVAVTLETPGAIASNVTGVDLGIANVATDSEGVRYSGAELRGVRCRRRRLRAKLQSKGTRSAKRRLKRLRRREARFARDVNHCISKRIVADAERTKSAIALEELRHIRTRVRASRQQRAELHSWSFGQLRSFITYKANLAGVPVILVDPRNSSRECSQCGHVDKRNRPNQATFKCRMCGYTAHADFNAAVVIRDRGRGLLSGPYAASHHGLAASLSEGS